MGANAMGPMKSQVLNGRYHLSILVSAMQIANTGHEFKCVLRKGHKEVFISDPKARQKHWMLINYSFLIFDALVNISWSLI